MSIGWMADDGTISIFTKDGVTVHKEKDVLITCKWEPILIGLKQEHRQKKIDKTIAKSRSAAYSEMELRRKQLEKLRVAECRGSFNCWEAG